MNWPETSGGGLIKSTFEELGSILMNRIRIQQDSWEMKQRSKFNRVELNRI